MGTTSRQVGEPPLRSSSHVSPNRCPSGPIPPWITMLWVPMQHPAWAPRGSGAVGPALRWVQTNRVEEAVPSSRNWPTQVSLCRTPWSLMPPKSTSLSPAMMVLWPKRPGGMPKFVCLHLPTLRPSPACATHVSSRCRPVTCNS